MNIWREVAAEDLDTVLCDRVHPRERMRVRLAVSGVLEEGRHWDMDVRVEGPPDTWRHHRLHLSPVPGASDRFRYRLLEDDAAHRRADRATWEAFHDTLTGLPNRVLLAERLNLAAGDLESAGVGVLFCDLDRFKLVNDTEGHLAGDQVLVEVAQALVDVVRPGDMVARYGGDEFVVVTADVTEAELAAIAARLRAAVARVGSQRPPLPGGAALGLSVGSALAQPGETVGELIDRADVALYEDKSLRRGPNLVARLPRPLTIAERQRAQELIDRAARTVAYEPIIDLRDGGTVGAEVLLRSSDGASTAMELIAAAEAAGVIVALGFGVLLTAVRELRRWDERPTTAGRAVSVNLAARQLVPGLCRGVLAALDAVGVERQRLVVDVREPVLAGAPARARQELESLRREGVRLAVDDFGTGGAGLSEIVDGRLDVVKIDAGWVHELLHSGVRRRLVGAICDLATDVGVVTVAEGVETPGQRAVLRELGVDLAQGRLFDVAGTVGPVNALVAGERDT